MKTKLLILLITLGYTCQGQSFISIPDSLFKKALFNQFPTCFIGNTIDSSCVANIEYFAISDSIVSLDGIEHFISLRSLSLKGTKLKTLPALPPNLEILDCSNNQIENITSIPPSVRDLNCSYNKLTSLPVLPPLKVLRCFYNNLEELPDPLQVDFLYASHNRLKTLPNLGYSMELLDCSHNLIDTIATLPQKLPDFFCSYNNLKQLPELPRDQDHFDCSHNQLTSLPPFRSSMRYFFCNNNLLTTLESFPVGITTINVSHNLFEKLPPISDYIWKLDFSYNLLTQIPKLPTKLGVLNCSGNPLADLKSLPPFLTELHSRAIPSLNCLPILPPSLEILNIRGTSIACLPNLPAKIKVDSNTLILPVCAPSNNKNHCVANSRAFGRIFLDENANGILDKSEHVLRGWKVCFSPSETCTFSNDSGYYELSTAELNTYLLFALPSPYFSSDTFSVAFNSYGQIIPKDIPIVIKKQKEDYSVQLVSSSRARPGFEMSLSIIIKNLGTVIKQSDVSFNFPDFFRPSSSSNAGTLSLNEYTWSIPPILPGLTKTILITGRLSPALRINDTLQFTSKVNTLSIADSNMQNNSSKLRVLVTGAFDPNDKLGPSTITPSEVSRESYIDYTVRFQNTGTDTAFTVIIADTLQTSLQWATLDFVYSSHPCNIVQKKNHIYFEFKSILLPDSFINEKKSHGFVSFRIKPQKYLVKGQTIRNKGSIYFDFNTPVVTNSVVTLIEDPILLNNFPKIVTSKDDLPYPNPLTSGYLQVPYARERLYKVLSISGEEVKKGLLTEQGIDMTLIKAGVYIIEIGNRREKVLVF